MKKVDWHAIIVGDTQPGNLALEIGLGDGIFVGRNEPLL
jgi:hypothetical protein